MPNYRDTSNKLHFIDSSEFKHLLPAGCVEITEAEAEMLKPQVSAGDQALVEISRLEATITPRRIREALISQNMSFINSVEAQIAELRVTI